MESKICEKQRAHDLYELASHHTILPTLKFCLYASDSAFTRDYCNIISDAHFQVLKAYDWSEL